MPQAPLPAYKIRKLLQQCLADNFTKTQTANQLRIARSSATKYVNAFRRSALTLSDIEGARQADFAALLFPNIKRATPPDRKIRLLARLASVHSRIEHDGLSEHAAPIADASRSLIKHSVARSYLTPQVSMKPSKASSASFLVSAIQISCGARLAFDCWLFGSLLSTLAVLCTQQRWPRVRGHTSSRACQKPSAPSATASSGKCRRPRNRRSVWPRGRACSSARALPTKPP
jgi:hypothetical protein